MLIASTLDVIHYLSHDNLSTVTCKEMDAVCVNRVKENEAVNQMSASNLGIVFGPTLLRPRCVNSILLFNILCAITYQAQ